MENLKIHLIAIGGAAMHNIALDLKAQGNAITGSDDEIYQPSLGRLKNAGIAPAEFGWFPEKITKDIDIVILGMHAKKDNPELVKALELGLRVMSYPAFIYQHSKNKKRVVIAGSHGKTTTTAMILHVLNDMDISFDYLVGAQLDGFDRMVKLTDAPLIVIEGDEYLSSALDMVPKIHHYKPHIGVITGIAWDHINVFPTFHIYKEQFSMFLDTFEEDGAIIYFEKDRHLQDIMETKPNIKSIPYAGLDKFDGNHISHNGAVFPISVIGQHNLENMNAALLVCQQLGISSVNFFQSIATFRGANKRLQKVSENENRVVFMDFAHAPSKVLATTHSVKDWYGGKKLLAVLELHTFSSLNTDFLPEYCDSLKAADEAIIYYNEHTIKMKNMAPIAASFVQKCFHHSNSHVFTDPNELHSYIVGQKFEEYNILLMSSGNFNNMPLDF